AMLPAVPELGLRGAWGSLLVAHVVITMPYVVRTVLGALSLFDFALIDAARTLGCSYPHALRRVLVPALPPAFLTSGMFAFLASMDNYPISIFFTDAWTKTLPIQMLQYVEESPDPIIAAVSTCLILLAVLVLFIGDRLVGLSRLADFWSTLCPKTIVAMATSRRPSAGPGMRGLPCRSSSTSRKARNSPCRAAMSATSTSTRPSRRSMAYRICAWKAISPTARGPAGPASGLS